MKKAEFGSQTWIEQVYESEDARQVAGRSRPTQRFAIAGANDKPTYAEGGNESVTRGLLILGVNCGLVKRWKFQPFALTKAYHGVEAIPDVLFEDHAGRNFVVEARSARYQTAEKLAKAKEIQSVINATGKLKYLYWTDGWPLMPCTASLVRELRRCGTSNIPRDSIASLQEVLKDGEPKTFFKLREMGCFRDVVMAAVWHGKAHIDLLSPVTDSTVVTSNPHARRFHELLNTKVGGQTWWSSLSKA